MSADAPTTVALQRRLSSPVALAAPEWQLLLERLTAAIAQGCDEAGTRVIGHIKAFAELPGGYARASAVDAVHAPTSEARASAPAATIDLTLNVLVYGLPAETAARLAEDILAGLTQGEGITTHHVHLQKGTRDEQCVDHSHERPRGGGGPR